jgi:membrane-associated phospholipid phosphatase
MFVDHALAAYVKSSVSRPAAEVARLFSILSDPVPYVAVLTAAYLALNSYLRRPDLSRRTLFVLLAITLSTIWVNILKIALGRMDPGAYLESGVDEFHFLAGTVGTSSFPSEHAALASALAMSLSILRPAYWPTFLLVAILTAAARVLVEAHYLSDVFAGGTIGALITWGLHVQFHGERRRRGRQSDNIVPFKRKGGVDGM